MSTGAVVLILVISHAAAFVLGGLVFRNNKDKFGKIEQAARK